jgi:hypothetical protein
MFPDYRGSLGAAPWSNIELTPEIEVNLKQAALRNCPSCAGDGYLGVGGKGKAVQLCSCVHRREEWKTYGP